MCHSLPMCLAPTGARSPPAGVLGLQVVPQIEDIRFVAGVWGSPSRAPRLSCKVCCCVLGSFRCQCQDVRFAASVMISDVLLVSWSPKWVTHPNGAPALRLRSIAGVLCSTCRPRAKMYDFLPVHALLSANGVAAQRTCDLLWASCAPGGVPRLFCCRCSETHCRG